MFVLTSSIVEIIIMFKLKVTATPQLYTLSLHDALPIWSGLQLCRSTGSAASGLPESKWVINVRSEEHTSELQSPMYLVCRLLLEKNNAGAGEGFALIQIG